MARKPYDPLVMIPSPERVRQRLTETLVLAERLCILLELAERLRPPAPAAERKGAVPLADAPPLSAPAADSPSGPQHGEDGRASLTPLMLRLDRMPLWRLLVAPSDAEATVGAHSPTARVLAREVKRRLAGPTAAGGVDDTTGRGET